MKKSRPSLSFALKNSPLTRSDKMIYKWIKNYSTRLMLDDALAGLSLSTIIIPQSLAYAELAKLPPVYGLYVSIIPPLVYAFLGNHLYTSIGTFAIVSIVISEFLSSVLIEKDDFVGCAGFLGFMIGIIQFSLAIFGVFDIISRYLFKSSFISGFTAASVITIITSQLKSFFGLGFKSQNGFFSVPKTWYLVISNLQSTKLATLLLSLSTVGIIVASDSTEKLLRKWHRKRKQDLQSSPPSIPSPYEELQAASTKPTEQVESHELNASQAPNDPIEENEIQQLKDIAPRMIAKDSKRLENPVRNVFPSILLAVVVLSYISFILDLPGNYGVIIIGHIPSGLPSFSWPWQVLFRIQEDKLILFGQIIYRALSLTIIIAVTSASIIDLYPGSNPVKMKSQLSLVDLTRIDSSVDKSKDNKKSSLNQEVLALSIAGIIASCFSCFTPCASISRGAILAKQTNVKSTLWNFFSAIIVLLSVFLLSDFFQNIPLGVLSAIIVVALLPSVKNISMIYKLVQKAKLDSKTYNENLKASLNIHIQDNIIASTQETIPKSAIDTEELQDKPLFANNSENTSQVSLNLFPLTAKSTAPSIRSTTSFQSTKRLIEKFPWSTQISEKIRIWSDVFIWSNTFIAVLLIDVSAGICIGLILKMKKILSIQSFVVHGHVGNSAAMYPLMLLGNQVDPLNTVQFCNHSGYKQFTGEITSPETLLKILNGLDQNGFLQAYEYVLLGNFEFLMPGYMGSTPNLLSIEKFLNNIKSCRPEISIFLDPVMGDHGKLYLPKETIEIYKRLISIASFITPNGFEASLLSGMEISDLNSIMKIFDKLHSMGPSTIIITSTELSDQNPDFLYLLCSDFKSQKRWMIEFPKLKTCVSGTGDLFNALLLGYLPKEYTNPQTLADSVEKACNAIQGVLKNTGQEVELAIVQSRDLILEPLKVFEINFINH